MNYHNITKDDMLNGDGLRVVLWTSGCSHHCKNCQNPITWDCNGGIPFDSDAKVELFEALDHDYISGLTLSGGDPLYNSNRDTIFKLCNDFREIFGDKKTIWLYTGYTYEEVKKEFPQILRVIDIMVDGKFVEELKDTNYHWAGSTNQRIINVKESLKQNKIIPYYSRKEDAYGNFVN